ncbi:hypothetical protein Kfla_4265 [Kribbella flavida DSM 17836]|uniref:Uncharacterized protein n=1 Tax=Kribbella flavida (strain DSM 17836 / JCM 10339 / NBRC 14399) TaxID=479435 RepID=D2PU17_KRIFD|nr:hypothetical protein [Kribbella flavida]ADB33300.1 hypothetical protein Kfla_4265 [Kribbella flavida DSM 17836]
MHQLRSLGASVEAEAGCLDLMRAGCLREVGDQTGAQALRQQWL